MKKSLQFCIGCISLFLSGFTLVIGQTVVLSENFSGFITGTHSTPSTSDASASLDTKTQTPGWSGSKIYSAKGEIKAGTESIPGWIETPFIDLSGNDGQFIVEFDICRWPGDATTVQVSINGTILGNSLTPSDNFESVKISGSGGTSNSKIKIQALTKRFFLDNFSVTAELITTGIEENEENEENNIRIYPVPVNHKLILHNINNINKIEISDLNGKRLYLIDNNFSNEIEVDFESMEKGIYFVRLFSGSRLIVKKVIKL